MVATQRNTSLAVNWLAVLPQYISNASLQIENGTPTRRRGPCPIAGCGGKDRFLFDNKHGDGMWFCNFCGGGNGFTLLRKALNMTDTEIFAAIDGKANTSPIPQLTAAEVKAIDADKIANRRCNLKNVWGSAVPVTATNAAGRYLANRVPGLNLSKLGLMLRFHAGLFYKADSNQEISCRRPALVAKVKDGQCEPVSLHRTYLSSEGTKAKVAQPKKLMSGIAALNGASIRLNKTDSRILAVTEGIETGLAVLAAHDYSITVWSLINNINLGMADIPKDLFDRVVIYADHDKIDPKHGYRPGQHSAEQLLAKLTAMGIPAEIVMPPVEGEDFADMWEAGKTFPLAV